MTRKYTKAEAIGIVVRCAQTYKQELDGKNLLFICTDKHKKTIPIELSFYGNNYLHLTGLKAPKSENGDIAVELFANDFYQKCLDHKLSQTDFDFAEDGTTHMKLDVLPTVISENLQAKMIGNYDSIKPRLYTEKVAGSTNACIGFVLDQDILTVPARSRQSRLCLRTHILQCHTHWQTRPAQENRRTGDTPAGRA